MVNDDDEDKPKPAEDSRRSIAVALRHEPEVGRGIPEVVASGRGKLAEQILDIAFAAGVRVREDADLAEVLAALDVGEDIPIEAFATVAEILAYVYRANRLLIDEPPPGVPS